jgi:hypothetical protein
MDRRGRHRRQRPDRLVLVLAVATVVAAGAALTLWTVAVDPAARPYLAQLQRFPVWMAILGVIGMLMAAVWGLMLGVIRLRTGRRRRPARRARHCQRRHRQPGRGAAPLVVTGVRRRRLLRLGADLGQLGQVLLERR